MCKTSKNIWAVEHFVKDLFSKDITELRSLYVRECYLLGKRTMRLEHLREFEAPSIILHNERNLIRDAKGILRLLDYVISRKEKGLGYVEPVRMSEREICDKLMSLIGIIAK